ncbi:MAG TPA: site-specific DNA-methyltransferase [Ignavibacteria bacterium]
MKQTKQLILKVLKNEARLWNEDKTELNQTKLLDILDNFGDKEKDLYENIISLLLQEKELKDEFFIKIKDVYVFKTNDFRFFMEENKIDNSYTAFKNRIGLSDGKKFLKDTNDVVLDFPYKDCVLEGGQSSEEGLDTFFEYSEKSEEYEEKKSKRKEIFFNQVLAHDEIDRLFDKKALVNWKRYTKDGEKEVGEIKRDGNGTIKENLIIKGNNLLALHSLKEQFAGKVKLIYIDPPYNTGNDGFKYNDNFNHSTWLTFMKNRLEVARELLSYDGSIYIQLDYNEAHYGKVLMDEIFGKDNFQREIIWDISVLSGYKTIANNWIRGHDSILFYSKNSKLLKFNKVKTEHSEKYLARFNKKDEETGRMFFDGRGKKLFLDEVIKKGKAIGDVWGDIISFQQAATAKERIKDFDGQKPENLLERIIKSATDEGDIVLDYHIGTGTTLSTAHKMGRQYIGIEQMDYVETIALERLRQVVNGEQGGISKSVDWKGGGDFVYCELAKWNETAKKQISDCKSLDELNKLFDEMYDKYFLNYNLKIKEFKEKVLKEEEFKKLSLDDQKKLFIAMLDNNQMYVNETEMEDKRYGISDLDQKTTSKFYYDKQ